MAGVITPEEIRSGEQQIIKYKWACEDASVDGQEGVPMIGHTTPSGPQNYTYTLSSLLSPLLLHDLINNSKIKKYCHFNSIQQKLYLHFHRDFEVNTTLVFHTIGTSKI